MLNLISAVESHLKMPNVTNMLHLTKDTTVYQAQFWGHEIGERLPIHLASPSIAWSDDSQLCVKTILMPASLSPFLSAARPFNS